MTDPTSAPGADPAVERFAAVLSAAGWELTGGDEWREDAAHGINVEAVLERPAGVLFMHYVPDARRISATVTDDTARELVEFGFGFDDAADLEGALRAFVAVQHTLVPRTLAGLLRTLYGTGRTMAWEVQE